jgi:hypothetical protein
MIWSLKRQLGVIQPELVSTLVLVLEDEPLGLAFFDVGACFQAYFSVGRDGDGGVTGNRALVLALPATVAPVGHYDRQTKPMPVVLLEDHGAVRALLFADEAPLVLRPRETLVPQDDGDSHPGMSSLDQAKRAD